MSRRERVPTSLLSSYLDGELGADEAAAIERVSVDSASVRQRLDSLRALRRALAAPVPALEARGLGGDLHAEAERQRRLRGDALRGDALRSDALRGDALRETVGRGWRGLAQRWAGAFAQRTGLVLAACALVLVGVGLGQLSPRPEELPSELGGERVGDIGTDHGGNDDVGEAVAGVVGGVVGDGVRSKSAARAANPSRWAGIQAFRLVPGGEPERLRKTLQPEDGLLFAYTNLGAEPFEHLMVFCVDAARELHWLYPAYTSESENPSSIRIQPGQELALSEVVWLDLPRGPLAIYAAFTREPLEVWTVEAWFAAHPDGGAGFAGPGAAVSQLAATVE